MRKARRTTAAMDRPTRAPILRGEERAIREDRIMCRMDKRILRDGIIIIIIMQ